MTVRLADVRPEVFAASFAKEIADVAEVIAAMSGLVDSIRTRESPSNIESIAHHVALYALGKVQVADDRTEMAINMLARFAYNRITGIEDDPDFDGILKSALKFAPQREIDAVVIGARARFCVERLDRVPVSWLAVMANLSYDACAMHVHRGRLRGTRGMVTSASARRWLEERASNDFDKIVNDVAKEAMPKKTKKSARRSA